MATQKNQFVVDDPVSNAPQHYRTLLENDRVRVLEYRSNPGDKSSVHSHPDSVIYSFAPATLAVSGLSGAPSDEFEVKAGEIMWRRETTHALENTGKTEAHLLVIELKVPFEPVSVG